MRRREVSRRSSVAMFLAMMSVVVVASGCSKGLPTSPAPSTNIPSTAMRQAGPASLSSTSSFVWSLLASQWVNKGDDVTVVGGPYAVHFVRGSLSAGAQMTIAQRDPLLVDFVLGPMGTSLSTKSPATLTINYAGTNADPGLTGFGRSPSLWRMNESTGAWELVAGTDNPNTKVFTAKVSVLCRYALSFDSPGKGGW